MDINDYDTWEKGSKMNSITVLCYYMGWRQFPDYGAEMELKQNPVVPMNTEDIDECLGKWKQPGLTEQNTREKRMSQRTL